MKYLILNADDFGYSAIFNEKILELLQTEKITSTTVMVNWLTDEQMPQLKKLQALENSKSISVGLHIEFENDHYAQQIEEQLEKFKTIFGKYPSHLDIHKSSSFPESRQLVAEYSKKLGIPCRNWGQSAENVKTTFNKFLLATEGFGPVKDFSDIEQWLENLIDEKYYEIGFHPGTYDPNCKSSLNKDREKDVENILRLNELLIKCGIQKVSYYDL